MTSLLFLTEMTVKSSVVLASAAGVCLLLRQSSAAARQFVLTFACAALLLLPLVSIGLQGVRTRIDPFPVRVGQTALSQTAEWLNAPESRMPQLARPGPPLPWRRSIVAIYLLGVALILARFLMGCFRIRRIVRGAAPFGESSSVPLLLTDRLPLPATWGLWRPVILLPQAAREWPAERLRLVIAHELAHIRRWDFPGQIAAQFVCTIYWFHPLAWWAFRRLVKEREQACDDEVLNMGVTATSYAEHLMSILRSANTNSRTSPIAIGMAHGTSFESRLAAMLNSRLNRRAPRRGTVLASALLAAVLLVPLAAVHAPAQSTGATISGTVRDPSGAVVPRARVLATNLGGSNVEAAYTAANGFYKLQGIPPGRYTIDIASPGFELVRQTGVALDAGANVQLDAAFRIGSLNESVEVVGKRSTVSPAIAPQGAPQRIRVGGNVQASKLLNRVKPDYPEAALAKGVQGTVLLRAVIGTDGRLLSVGAASASSDPDLTQAALDAVRLWSYEPTLLNGEPVEVITTVAVTFRLE